jgi:predicted secreted protein
MQNVRLPGTGGVYQIGHGGGPELARPFFISDNNTVARMVPGLTFRIVLPENGSTGYQWQPMEKCSPLYEVVGSTYLSGGNAVGSGGTRIFTLRIKDALPPDLVRGSLVLLDKRSWEPTAAQKFTLNIVPA